MIQKMGFDAVHLMGESATHPIAPLATRLGALHLLAGFGPLRRCPCRAQPGRSQGSLVPFKWAQAHLKLRHGPYPCTPSAAHSGAPN